MRISDWSSDVCSSDNPAPLKARNLCTDWRNMMSYAIIGFGKIGQALAHAFARKDIDVTVASRRPPEALAPQARAIGPTVVARSLREIGRASCRERVGHDV